MANRNESKLIILRRKQVEQRTGLSRSTIYLRIQDGTFPKPIPLGPRAVGWIEHEIDAWLASRLEKRDSGRAQSITHGNSQNYDSKATGARANTAAPFSTKGAVS